jgi:hypothetical protein
MPFLWGWVSGELLDHGDVSRPIITIPTQQNLTPGRLLSMLGYIGLYACLLIRPVI